MLVAVESSTAHTQSIRIYRPRVGGFVLLFAVSLVSAASGCEYPGRNLGFSCGFSAPCSSCHCSAKLLGPSGGPPPAAASARAFFHAARRACAASASGSGGASARARSASSTPVGARALRDGAALRYVGPSSEVAAMLREGDEEIDVEDALGALAAIHRSAAGMDVPLS